jgi:ribosomal protein S18 acetylase RimI-like enzyme
MAGHTDTGGKVWLDMTVMKNFQIRPINKTDRDWIIRLLQEWWAGPKIVTRGKIHHADRLLGFVAIYNGKPTGLVTYNIDGNECQIITMNSLVEGIGIGSALIDAVRKATVPARCKRLWLITTNDNTAALRFYQKRGFVLVALYRDAIEESRHLKPEIPLFGNNDIPIRDEIEFELIL